MKGTGNRLGFALLFTGFAVALNAYVVMNGSAAQFYENVTETFFSDNKHTAEVNPESEYRLLDDDCSRLAQLQNGPVMTTAVSQTKCSRNDAVGI